MGGLYGVRGSPDMNVTFELPSPVVQRLRSHVSSGERSKFVADLIFRKLQKQRNALKCAAQKPIPCAKSIVI
jgi:hypothetical protein